MPAKVVGPGPAPDALQLPPAVPQAVATVTMTDVACPGASAGEIAAVVAVTPVVPPIDTDEIDAPPEPLRLVSNAVYCLPLVPALSVPGSPLSVKQLLDRGTLEMFEFWLVASTSWNVVLEKFPV